jgi:hypothetical protein
MQKKSHVLTIALVAVLTVTLAAACASRSSTVSPSASPSAASVDVARLAGNWQGFADLGNGRIPVAVRVSRDGTYASTMGAATGNGTFQVRDGVVVTTGHLSGPAYGADRQSTAVLSERDGRLQISGEGRSDRGPFSYVIQKTN